jgi:dihydroorotase
VGEAGYESRSANCAFDGRRLTGRVRMTIAGGAVAYRERSFALGAVG